MGQSQKINYRYNNSLKMKPTTGLKKTSFAYWYEGNAKDDDWHFEKFRGRWHLLLGKHIIARQPPVKAGEHPPGYGEFVRFCKIFLEKPQTKIIERAKTFEEEMQFFTAYWFRKEIDK